MEDEDSVVLNLSTDGGYHREKKQKPKKLERLRNKKHAKNIKKAADFTDESELPESSASLQQDHSPETASPTLQRKRKRDGKDRRHEPRHKYQKVSSLFRNNPDIPHVESVQVDQVKEEVFSQKSFKELSLHPFMVSNLEDKLSLTQMTSVQQKAIPAILDGKDVLVKSQTGSGKTLAYAVPLIQRLQELNPKVKRSDGPYAVIIVPTRELAIQSFETFQKLIYPFQRIVAGSIMGGEKKKSEKARLRKGVNVLVATPGRLLDHLEHTQSLNLAGVQWLIIDEADRLLDLGFEKDVSQIIQALDNTAKPDRQTVLLSATLTSGVQRLAGMSLHDPKTIDMSQHSAVTSHNKRTNPSTGDSHVEKFATPENLKHHFVVVPTKLRLVTLAAFILSKCKYSTKKSKMVVFLATQSSVQFHYTLFLNSLCDVDDDDEDLEFPLFQLYGDMEQKERTKTYFEFCDADFGVLLCTDVAARGLDLPHVTWIVQYNSPGSATDYIHRVGRTARAGSQGHALLFLAPSEVEYIKVLTDYNISMNELEVDKILKTLLLKTHGGNALKHLKVKGSESVQQSAISIQASFEKYILEHKDTRTLARKAFNSCARAYCSYPAHLKHIFNAKSAHLGHLAKSFALNETPSQIGEMVSYQAKKYPGSFKHKSNDSKSGPRGFSKKKKFDVMSEFSSGF